MQVIYDSPISTITYDPQTNIVYKTVKKKLINQDWFDLYKIFQQDAPVVKVLDIVDKNTYTMEYIPNIICTVEDFVSPYDDTYNGYWTKDNFIDLHNTVTQAWQTALSLSKTLSDNKFFVSGDLQLSNMVVTKEKNGMGFTVIDPDSWFICDGYYGVESYYQLQLMIGLVTQRLIK
jgi:hypothetical protein